MFKTLTTFAIVFSLLVCSVQPCLARGGGGFHGGGGFGGGFHGGGFGGYGGGFHGGGYGGFHGGGYGGYHAGGYGGGYRGYGGGYRGDGFGGAARAGELGRAGEFGRDGFAGNRGIGNHTGLPSDFGFGHAGARSYLPAGNRTQAWSHNTMVNRGNTVRNNYWNHNYFNHNWWHDHPGAWFAAGWGLGTAWGWSTWPVLGGWYGWGAGVAPVYYDYGTNVTYDGDEVYYGDQPYASADDYYQQAVDIANNAPATGDTEGEWKPLGVFGLVQGDQDSASAVFQLATNKQGAIAGNFADSLTGSTMQVHGSVDQKTQRAAWTVGDNKDTVYEAGIVNLTKEQAPVLVHFGKDRTQQWLLVRLKQPDQAQQPDASGATQQ